MEKEKSGVLTRGDIAPKYKWDMSVFYPDQAAWEKDFDAIKGMLAHLADFNGKLKSKDVILECLKFSDEMEVILERLYTFSASTRDENTADAAHQARADRAEGLYFEYMSAASFITPQLSKLPLKFLKEMAADPLFKDHAPHIRELIRKKPHILSDNEEKLLSMAGEMASGFENVFSMINNIEIGFPKITVDGEEVQLTHGRFALYLSHGDESVRRAAFEGVYSSFKKLINTLAANYSANVKKYVFYSRARNYQNTVESFLSSEGIPGKVYEKLVSAVGANITYLHDYMAARGAILQKPLHMYDLHVPIVEGAELKLEYEDACRLVKDALAPLGEEYQRLLERSFKDGWIDVYETENKRSGAYCTHAYGFKHPYVLLNYTKTTHDVFTIAHELGHAMHSHYSAKNQPFSLANYKIFVAEVASTVNEVLLLNYLIKNAADKQTKKYLVSYYLDMFRTTFFRQTMFAQFEKETHEMSERGEPLTAESLSDLYYSLNQKFYGESVVHDDYIRYEWSRIPHFYYGFYVYKYSTGFTAAINIAHAILKGEKGALNRYYDFLSAGCSDTPYNILKAAGVDLGTDKPYNTAMKVFSDNVALLKKLFGVK